MKETITYKNRTGVTTREVLRSITEPDQHWLKTVMLGYLCLESVDPRPEFAEWFNKPNEHLPRQPLVANQHNSPKSFCEGILAKLEQNPKRRDLSPKQCEGIEQLTQLMQDIFPTPRIVFAERTLGKPPSPEFTTLFGGKK